MIPIRLSDTAIESVRQVMRGSAPDLFSLGMLGAVHARSERTGVPLFAGVDPVERARRRAVGKAARRARRANRR